MQHNIILPDLGQTTSEAKISQWLKRPGDRVERGEPVMVVETDKVDMEVESFESGFIREFLVAEGSIAKALEPVAILTETADEKYESPLPAPPPVNGSAAAGAAPAAKALARELGVDLAGVKGTGPKGLITRADVQKHADATPKPNRALSAMAATVVASKRDIPHFYATRDLEMTHASGWRDQWNQQHPDVRASFNDVFVWCAAHALADVPRLNVAWRDGKFEQHTATDILVVVAQDDALLLKPVADPRSRGWEQFLARTPDDKAAPLLAISNLGMYGIKEFSAIIPPGCTSVLAIGAVRDAPAVRGGAIVIEKICTCTLSADHRVVDGIAAARFLGRVQFHLNSL